MPEPTPPVSTTYDFSFIGTGLPIAIRAAILRDVMKEMEKQDAKWGEQNHPNGTGPDMHPLVFEHTIDGPFRVTAASQLMKLATVSTNERAAIGTPTWRDILLEEVFEALAEDDGEKLAAELVQVAAVALQWNAAIVRQFLAEGSES